MVKTISPSSHVLERPVPEKSVLRAYFNKTVVQASPVFQDKVRVPKRDSKGAVYNSYEPVDYSKIQASFGSVDNWSLNSMIRAGVDPKFPIRTGNATRLEGVAEIQNASEIAEQIFNESSEEQTSEE